MGDMRESRHNCRLRWLPGALVLASAVLVTMTSSPLVGQGRRTLALGSGELADRDFTSIVGVRELSDGSVLVADRSDGLVFHTGFGEIRGRGAVGRRGDGPGEYRSVSAPVPIGLDSTLIVDRRRNRWVLIDDRLRVLDLGLYRRERDEAGMFVAGGTEAGEVLAQALPPGVRSINRADSLFLVRLRSEYGIDTLTVLDGVGAGPLRQAIAGWFVSENPLVPRDHAGLAPDGTVAVLRHEPYRVEWFRSGDHVVGGTIQDRFGRLTDEAKCRAMGALRDAQDVCDPAVYNDWPRIAPAYSSFSRVSPLIVATRDLALVRRFPESGGAGQVYDVIDGRGDLVAELRVGESEIIVGASDQWIYVANVDEFGLQALYRHPLPSV